MILVTVGTQPQNFSRLIKKSDNLNEDLLIQLGNTKYETKHKSFSFTNNFMSYVQDAEIIITHGGVGTIMNALKLNKKIIVLPRLKKFNEHINDHQLEICLYLEKNKLAYILKEDEDLELAIIKVRNTEFEKFNSNNDNFNNKLKDELYKMENNGKSI